MPQFEFERKISIGNLVSVGTVLVGLVWGWSTLATGMDSNARDLLRLSERVTVIEAGFTTLTREIANDRIAQTRILTELQTDMRYLRTAIDDLRSP